MSVTIIADDAMTADALSTGCFVLGPKRAIELLERLDRVEGMLIAEGLRVFSSSGWSAFKK